MYKLTFKNRYGQKMEVHGTLGSLFFMPNEGDPISCTSNEFLSIEKVDKNGRPKTEEGVREHSRSTWRARKLFKQCKKRMPGRHPLRSKNQYD